MNALGKLIKSKTIPFVDTIIKNYSHLNLNEKEVVVLIKLSYLLDEGTKIINIDNLSKEMTLNKNELSSIILSLVERKFIEIELINGKEEFSIDNVYDKLGVLLDVDSIDKTSLERERTINDIVNYLQQMFNRLINSNDLLFINKWLDNNIEVSLIKDCILETAKQQKTAIKYTDAIIESKKPRNSAESSVEPDEEFDDFLKQIYVK